MASKVETEVEVKSPLDKFWDALRSSTELFPKVFPEQYESIEVIEGDGKGVGTVRLLKYAKGVPLVTFAKEKVEEADDANKVVAYSVIDGELLSLYKTFKIALKMAPKDEGSLVQWSLAYDKARDDVPEPDLIKETAVKTFNDLDAYLIKNSFWRSCSCRTSTINYLEELGIM